jgi:hypothetical protein
MLLRAPWPTLVPSSYLGSKLHEEKNGVKLFEQMFPLEWERRSFRNQDQGEVSLAASSSIVG